ncbi:hypothetical protein CLOM621_07515 [Clostridium sp. M62/1]|nr:hypothetical protein CLOM621_07515 [Clostridium sp. M62/1]
MAKDQSEAREAQDKKGAGLGRKEDEKNGNLLQQYQRRREPCDSFPGDIKGAGR